MITVEDFASVPPEALDACLADLSDPEWLALKYDWRFWARPTQLAPPQLGTDNKFIWMALAGRGYGKTRMMGEWFRGQVATDKYKYTSLAGATADDVRAVMIEGESGLLKICPTWFYPDYQSSRKKLVWPNGAETLIFYGSEPDVPRGKQSSLVWCDELAKWRYPEETLDNILFGLRLGDCPMCGITTTPRPIKVIKDLAARPDCIVTGGSSYENRANLSAIFINTILGKYEGTRLGLQEIDGRVLDDNPGALWRRTWLDTHRIVAAPSLERIVVAIDPQGADPDGAGIGVETGIVCAGRGRALPGMAHPDKPHYYVLEDLSLNGTPEQWGRQAVSGYEKHQADKLVGEKNYGGEMVRSTIHAVKPDAPYKGVTASRGKVIRAEPISTLSEQGRIHHVGFFRDLEDQLCEWVPGMPSPNRLDALVWAITELSEGPVAPPAGHQRRTDRTRSKVRDLPV